MSICHIYGANLKKLDSLFHNWNETLIWSCLHGFMGSAWADDIVNPTAAQIIIADFCFLAGSPNEELVRNKPQNHKSNFIIMVPENEEWAKLIEKVYKEKAVKVTRYATKKEKDIFNKEKLKSIVKNIESNYEIKLIDEKSYNMIIKNEWSKDLCSQFKDFNDYKKRGLGTAAFINGELVSGASSYTVYKNGIEIQIDTREDYRRKGLASACGAKLILECLKRNLYPSWDAQNQWSLSLAEKLGYHFDKEYYAYEIYGYSSK